MRDYKKIRERFEGAKIYTYKQVLDILCPSQSSTAEYILQDLLASGSMVKTLNGYRINQ